MFALFRAGFLDERGARWTRWIPLLSGSRFGVRVPGGARTRTGPYGPVLLRSARHRAIATTRQHPMAGLPGHPRPIVVSEALTARPSSRRLGSQRTDQIRVGSLRSPPEPEALLARLDRSPRRVQPALEPIQQLTTGDERPLHIVRTELQIYETLRDGDRAIEADQRQDTVMSRCLP